MDVRELDSLTQRISALHNDNRSAVRHLQTSTGCQGAQSCQSHSVAHDLSININISKSLLFTFGIWASGCYQYPGYNSMIEANEVSGASCNDFQNLSLSIAKGSKNAETIGFSGGRIYVWFLKGELDMCNYIGL